MIGNFLEKANKEMERKLFKKLDNQGSNQSWLKKTSWTICYNNQWL